MAIAKNILLTADRTCLIAFVKDPEKDPDLLANPEVQAAAEGRALALLKVEVLG